MANNLITNLILKAQGWDSTLTNSTNQVRKFQREVNEANKKTAAFTGNIKSQAIGALTKFAGAAGIAYGSFATFKGIMESTRVTSDKFGKVMAQAKGAVDHFFQSIATGNWSNLLSGLNAAIDRAGTMHGLLSDLGDAEGIGAIFDMRMEADLTKFRAIIDDPDATKAQKEAATKLINSTIMKYKDRMGNVADLQGDLLIETLNPYFDKLEKTTGRLGGADRMDVVENMLRMLAADSKEMFIVKKAMDLAYQNDKNNFGKNPGLEGVIAQLKQPMSKEKAEELEKRRDALLFAHVKDFMEGYESEYARLGNPSQAVRNLASYQLSKDLSSEDLDIVKDTFMKAVSAENKMHNLERMYFRNLKRSRGGTSTTTAEEIFPEGSIAQINKLISEVQGQIELEIDPQKQKELYAELKKLEDVKLNIEIAYKNEAGFPEGSLAHIQDLISKKEIEISLAVDSVELKMLSEQLNELMKQRREIEITINPPTKPTEGVRDTLFDYNLTKAQKITNDLQLKNIYIDELKKNTDLFADELNKAMNEADELQHKLNFELVTEDLKTFNRELNNMYLGTGKSILNVASSFDSLYKSVKALGEEKGSIIDLFNSIERSLTSIVNLVQLVSSISDIVETIKGAQEAKSLIMDEGKSAKEIAGIAAVTAAKTAGIATETSAQIAANATVTASMLPLITAANVLMATQTAAHYAPLGLAGIPMASSQMATYKAMIAASAIPALADGGVVYGNTIAQVGEYGGVRSNPEVIAPLNKLKDILFGGNNKISNSVGEVQFKIDGKDLVGVLNTQNKINSRR